MTQPIRYTTPTLSAYVIERRLSQSDIQYRPYLHMLPWVTQPIRCTIPTLSTYTTVRRLSRSDRQCWPYLHMSPSDDSVDQIYNTDPIYLCLNEKTQFIRYTIPTLSTYATMIRLSRSDIQYRPYLHMLPWQDSVNQTYNIDPIYICYHEKTQSIRCTIPTISTYITMRRLSQSDIQYRPYLHMLPWEYSVNQIYNTDPIYICYHEKNSVDQIYNTDPIYIYYHKKTQSIRHTVAALSTCYHEKTQSIRYTIPTLSTYATIGRRCIWDIQCKF
jgi:hypothetical protein